MGGRQGGKGERFEGGVSTISRGVVDSTPGGDNGRALTHLKRI